MKKLYICHTLYHIYITIIKEINNKDIVDIILSDIIPDCNYYKETLLKTGIFNNVEIINESNIDIDVECKTLFDKITYNNRVYKILKSYISIDETKYDDIFIYNDWTPLGYYLITSSIKFNLIEDGLNSFNIVDKFGTVETGLKSKVLEFLGVKILHFGQSKYVKSIEINQLDGIKIPQNKTKVVPRSKLINSLNEEDKKLIYDIFIGEKSVNITLSQEKKIILILTQPLFEDKSVASEDKQYELYCKILKKYTKSDDIIFIKPHPRDLLDYERKFPYICIVDKNIPIEVLNYNSNIKIDKVITITSTAIDGIDFTEEKIKLGFDWLNENK